ncbi:hypothetical protein OO013_07670 [Mangrovivirga sp. M17]|uniref:Phage abortive infection protein n=1 Tax=Mangrovivirga halotolerans TaxID=2993936 RepID=A0ABT3RR44_9BACT|nr:hypothetical protein [Mangrovivirga halotolerans]MCX2743737.1 hypothetical protein [Mangrovivirga halotolerans]
MMEFINSLDIKLQATIISALTSLFIFVVGWLFKFFYERNSLSFRLDKEYTFEQKKKLKEEISKYKIPLLNACEEFNYRLRNFNKRTKENLHRIDPDKWFETDQYYLNSFIYRFLVILHYVYKIEQETLSIDSTVADKSDIKFLKFIKTFKNIFSELDLLTPLGYKWSDTKNHFWKNELKGFTLWVVENDRVIEFDEFVPKLRFNYNELRKIIEYFSKIENDPNDKTLNVLRCFHLLIIQFLNFYGHTYQVTPEAKVNTIVNFYSENIKIVDAFENFISESKLDQEMKSILKKLKAA